MTNFVGKEAPDFTSLAILPDNSFKPDFNLRTHLNGRYAVLIFYPMNFGYVEPTEMIALQQRLGEFQQRKTEIITISTDTHLSHLEWKKKPIQAGGIGNVQFPMVSDITRRVANGFEVLVNDSMCMRATFVLDGDHIVRYQATHDLPFGRNVDEIIRVIDALQYHEKNGMVTPEGWVKGQRGYKPTPEGYTRYFEETYNNSNVRFANKDAA